MLTYNLQERNDIPLYLYLYSCIKNDILEGNIKPHEKLPSKRLLAKNHDISIITVENAYEQLIVEGYIYSIEKRGYFVAEIEALKNDFGAKTDSATMAGMIASGVGTSGVGTSGVGTSGVGASGVGASRMTASGIGAAGTKNKFDDVNIVADFTSNQMVYQGFPFSVWSKIMRKALLDEEAIFNIKPESIGVWQLRKAIANHIRSFRGINVNEDNIIIGAGTEYLYGLLVQLLGRNGMIAVEDPGHTKIHKVYESNGIKVQHIPIDDKGIMVEALENHRVMAIHITPSHHFPTGIVMPAARRHQLIAYARSRDSYIIEDDYDSEFRFSGKPLPAMASLDMDRVVYLNTFSKTLSPSIRIAYMVLPDRLMNIYRQKLSFYSCTVSSTEQYTLANFIEGGYYERHINRTRNFYKEYRNKIFEIIKNSKIASKVTIEDSSGGLHFVLRIDVDVDDDRFVERLREHGIKISSVREYCYRPIESYRHSFIINYSNVLLDELENALEIISEVINNK